MKMLSMFTLMEIPVHSYGILLYIMQKFRYCDKISKYSRCFEISFDEICL